MVVMSILTGTMSLGRRLQAAAYATRMRNMHATMPIAKDAALILYPYLTRH